MFNSKNWTAPLAMAALLLGVAGATVQAKAEDKIVVAKIVDGKTEMFDGKPHVVIIVQSVDGKKMTFGIKNVDDQKYTANPDPDILSAVKQAGPGGIVKISYYANGSGPTMANNIEPYNLQPGEEQANGFVFQETYDHREQNADYTYVDVKRFEQLFTFMIPNMKDASGDMVPQPDLMAAFGKFKQGDVVLLDVMQGRPKPIVTNVEAYTAPQTGTLKGTKTAELQGNKTTEADIDVSGTPVTAMVPGHLDGKHWTVDGKVLAELRRIRPNTPVTFRAAAGDDGTMLLRDIELAPKPADTDSSMAGKTGTDNTKTASK